MTWDGDTNRTCDVRMHGAREPDVKVDLWTTTTHKLVAVGLRTFQCMLCRMSTARSRATSFLKKHLYCDEVERPLALLGDRP